MVDKEVLPSEKPSWEEIGAMNERIEALEKELGSYKSAQSHHLHQLGLYEARERGNNQREFIWKALLQCAVDAEFDADFEEGGKTVRWLPLAKGMLF